MIFQRSRFFAWPAFLLFVLAALVSGVDFPTFGFLGYSWLVAGGLASFVLSGIV